ncbi:Transcriptional regulator, LysR family [Acinetobacter sp. neg1]|uniref:LysR family transcriptional regulator n=1 Tax=Acinetobacter sp. neg1 TaxID=1561068 RepID=UPI0005427423|nr:LysR family transcriptional regulator [Acinetobacter sp. neg1]KHF78802.1 Transcriptional regulator, LysR family [Acinetobacter sp. neg1]
MKIKELEAFLALIDEGGIVNAATKLHCVPSNISKLINELEEKCCEPLFNRENRELILTPYGRNFYEETKIILYEIDMFKANTMLSPISKLVIGGLDIALDYFLPDLIYKYISENKNDNTHLHIFRDYSINLENKLSNLEYDVIFSDGPLTSPRLESKLVFFEKLILVKGSAAHKTPIIYTFSNQCTYREYIEQWSQKNLKNYTIREIESYPLMLKLIENNIGMTFMPQSIIKDLNVPEHLIHISSSIESNIYIIWNKKNLSQNLVKFIKFIQNYSILKKDLY